MTQRHQEKTNPTSFSRTNPLNRLYIGDEGNYRDFPKSGTSIHSHFPITTTPKRKTWLYGKIMMGMGGVSFWELLGDVFLENRGKNQPKHPSWESWRNCCHMRCQVATCFEVFLKGVSRVHSFGVRIRIRVDVFFFNWNSCQNQWYFENWAMFGRSPHLVL